MAPLISIALALLSVDAEVGTTARATVEGRLLYPACTEIPADLEVCGEDQATGEATCTRPFLTDQGYAYKLELAPGTYRVYAATDSARPGYRAYYSESVVCGLRAECSDHTPIALDLRAGDVRANVEPADWFSTGASALRLALHR